MSKSVIVRASVKPHRHTNKMCGPHLLMLGTKGQPPLVTRWNPKNPALFCVEQTNPDNNFSIIRLLFLLPGRPRPEELNSCDFKKITFHPRKDGTLAFFIRKRYTDTLAHSLPVGPFQGSCVTGDGFVSYTFQSCTLYKAAEPSKPKTIITPGDIEYDLTLARAKRIFSRADGVGGGGIDAGGLRHG